MGKPFRTTFDIDEDIWNKFSAKVVTTKGNRKLGEVMTILVQAYAEGLIDIKRLERALQK